MELQMFMWQWQHVFQEAVAGTLEKILEILELQTITNVFLVGVPTNNEDTNSIFFHPEDCGFLPTDFQNVFKMVKNNYDNDPGQNLMMAAAHLYEAHRASLLPKAVQKAVQAILDNYSDTKGTVSFCSFPVEMNEHWVVTVIQLDMKFFEKQYRLQSNVYETNPIRKYRIDRSFLEAIIWKVLSASQSELLTPSEGNNYWFADPERLLEDAAASFLFSIKVRVNEMGGNLLALSNAISAERYEGAGSRGRLIVAKQDHPSVNAHIKLEVPIEVGNYRGIRKLLEVSSNTMALLCDGESIWGLGETLCTYDPSSENLFEFRFTEHYTWELIHAENVMLKVRYRQPRLPREKFDETLFRDHVSRLFNVSEAESTKLVEAVNAAVAQRHGTMLVITPTASKESERLSAQSTVIKPTSVTKTLVSHVSGVDGAILVSPDGVIHAFGVILDGLASGNGNPGRGARFNSAIRYVDGQSSLGMSCLALIVSEDGYVDLYPKLRPRIQRALIDELLQELEKYAGSPENFDADKAWSTLVNLCKLKFYLLESDVKRANTAKKTVVKYLHEHRQKEMSEIGMGYILPLFDDFSLHEEMNLEYYLPENLAEPSN